ncbi:hypothetical protein NQZ79_g4905 [Umbelopsis isabellina]|nr:hypothetical protein NQZ79_g4905 [Umbelopsis isabellina]
MSRFKQPPPHTSPPPSPLSPTSPPPLSTLTSHFVQALHDYIPENLSAQDAANCLCFTRGNIIEVLGRDDSGWWDGTCKGSRGWFPSNYVGMIGEVVRAETYSDEEEDAVEENSSNSSSNSSQSSNSSNDDSLCGHEEDNRCPELVLPSRLQMARALLAEHQPNRKSEKRLHHRRSRASHLLVSWDNLINPIIQSASLLADSNDQTQYLPDVISAVRYLLACSGAIENDAPLLDNYPELAEQRRIVLSCLSHLVVQTRTHVDLADSANELIEAVKEYAVVARESGMGNPSQNADRGAFQLDDSYVSTALKFHTRERNIADKLEGHRINVFSLLDNIAEQGIITFEKRAQVLEITRKAVESVRAYLSVLERDLATESTNILEEANMVSVVLSKEAIYTAATNLVTAVRVASASHESTSDEQKEDNEQVQISLERVRVAILDSLRAVRYMADHASDAKMTDVHARERLEMSASLRRAQTLSYLSRKATSLDVLKGQYLEDVMKEREITSGCLDEEELQQVQAQLENHATSEGRKSLDEAHALIRNEQHLVANNISSFKKQDSVDLTNGHRLPSDHCLQADEISVADEIDSLAIGDPCSIDSVDYICSTTMPNKLDNFSVNNGLDATRKNLDRSQSKQEIPAPRRKRESSLPQMIDSRHFSENSVRTSGTSSRLFRQSVRSSLESYHMTPVTSPEPMSPISDADSVTFQILQKSHLDHNQRPMSDAISQVHKADTRPALERPHSQQPHYFGGTTLQNQRSHHTLSLPPQDGKVISSKSTPTDNQSKQGRRSRGMSVSSIKMSLRANKEEELPKPLPHRESSHFKAPTLRNLRRVGSWRDSEIQVAPSPEVKERKSNEPEAVLPWFLESQAMDVDEESVIYNADGQVMGGTLKALIQRLTMHDKATDITFSNAFLLNFHLFTTPDEFVAMLKERFMIQPPGDIPLSESDLGLWATRIQVPIRLRVYNVIKTWLEGFFSIEHDRNMRDTLMDFAADTMAQAMPGPAKRMVELINRRFSCNFEGQLQQQQVLRSRRGTIIETQQTPSKSTHRPSLQKTKSYSSLSFTHKTSSITGSSLFNLAMFDDNNDSSLTAPPPAPIVAKSLRQLLKKFATDNDAWKQINLLDIDPVELARQMTLIENTLFCDIVPQEMLGQEFKKKVGVSSAIHVKAMIQLSTRVTGWIADSVLNEKEVKRRAAMIKYWIKVGDSCLQLQNYNTLMAIRSALDSTGISRLKRTWEIIATRHRNTLETLRAATDTSRNFAKYRQRLKGAIAPCLPFLGVYLTDMTFIDDGNSNVRTNCKGKDLINFDKHIKATKVITEIQRFQIPYRLVPVEELQLYLHRSLDSVMANDQELYARSLLLEPREEDVETHSAASSERS